MVAGLLGVPSSAIGRKSFLARMGEVEEDYPDFDWWRLQEFEGFRTIVPVGNPVGYFRTSLGQVVGEILEGDAAKERAEREEAERQERIRAKEERRDGIQADLDRLKDRYDDLTGRPGDAGNHLGYLRGPNGMPSLSRQVAYLAERVAELEYEKAHENDVWTGDPSTVPVPSWVDGTARNFRFKVTPGKVFRAWVTDEGKLVNYWYERRVRPGVTLGYFRWTDENGLELAGPDDES
jgi:hypothetical protein